MNDWYENSLPSRHSGEGRSPSGREVPRVPYRRKSPMAPHFHSLMRRSQDHGDSGKSRSPEEWGAGNLARSKIMPTADSRPENYARRGGRPPLGGRGGEWWIPARGFSVRSRNSVISYLDVPAQTGMNDWYENRRVQDASSRKTAATFVIPAKAGIQRGGGGRHEWHPSALNRSPHFHPLVCRLQRA